MNDLSAPLLNRLSCSHCQTPRHPIRCLSCGDRLSSSAELTPYERLAIHPAPLIDPDEVRSARDRVMSLLHPLKISRYHATWAAQHRALVMRDYTRLLSTSQSLVIYVERLIDPLLSDVTSSSRAASDSSRDDLDPLEFKGELDVGLESSGVTQLSTSLDSSLLEHTYHRDLHIQWDELSAEFRDLDAHQERNRMIHGLTYELLDRAKILEKALLKIVESGSIDQLHLKTIHLELSWMTQAEAWVDLQHKVPIDRWERVR